MTVPFAAYPMVEEEHASGRVAAVYADMLTQMPMVPSLFRTLALCPPYLVMAWRQTAPVLQDGRAEAAGSELASRVRDVTPPPVDPTIRDELGQFVGPLGRMLFIASGLRLALDGDIRAAAARADIEPRASAPEAQRTVPSSAAIDDPRPFDAIRRDLSTPIVNSLWRHLAGLGLLASAWEHLGPHAPASMTAGGHLGDRARMMALETDWPVAATPAALSAAGCPDAASGMAAVLDGYRMTLPRVLALVAGCAPSTNDTSEAGVTP